MERGDSGAGGAVGAGSGGCGVDEGGSVDGDCCGFCCCVGSGEGREEDDSALIGAVAELASNGKADDTSETPAVSGASANTGFITSPAPTSFSSSSSRKLVSDSAVLSFGSLPLGGGSRCLLPSVVAASPVSANADDPFTLVGVAAIVSDEAPALPAIALRIGETFATVPLPLLPPSRGDAVTSATAID
jgi:hypothetical protein